MSSGQTPTSPDPTICRRLSALVAGASRAKRPLTFEEREDIARQLDAAVNSAEDTTNWRGMWEVASIERDAVRSRQQTLQDNLSHAESRVLALREQIIRNGEAATIERDKCQFCLGVKGGEPGEERTIGGALACAECAELVQAAIDNTQPASTMADRVRHWKDGTKVIDECLARSRRSDLSDAPGSLGGEQAKLWKYAQAEAYRHALEMMGWTESLEGPTPDDASTLWRMLRETTTRAAEIARLEDAGEIVSLVTPFGGTVTDPDELEMHRQLKALNISRCAMCANTGRVGGIQSNVVCGCPYGEFLAKKIQARDVSPGEE